MTDERSLNAVDVAIAFGEGKATREELDAAAYTAYAAADGSGAAAAAAAATDAATDAADAAAATATAVAYAAYAASNRQQTADICREYIGESLIQKVNQLL
jgi:hypothetical protein